MTDNLTDVFNDSTEAADSAETVVDTGVKEVAEKVETLPDTNKSEPPAEENKEESWTKKAVLDERKKRQAAESELAKYKENKVNSKEPEEITPEQQSLQKIILNERINLSREMMLDKHEDYEEYETIFIDMAKENPALVTQMQASPNPAKFAYQQAKQLSEAKKLSDPTYVETLKKQMYEEILKQIEAEKENDKVNNSRKKAALSVNNLVKATSANEVSHEEQKDPLAELFD